MKFIRRLLGGFVALLILALVVVLLAVAPTVQTWFARERLSTGPIHGTLESLSAGFGEIDVEDLHLQMPSGALTLPSLKAKMPVAASLFGRRAHVYSLVAKGWTLDLSNLGAAGAANSSGPSGVDHVRATCLEAFQGLFSALSLPREVVLDQADLDGDILLPQKAGLAPSRLHLTVSGGGLSEGHPGVFSVDATCSFSDPAMPIDLFESSGQATVELESGRRIARISLTSQVSTKVGTVAESFTLSASAGRTHDGSVATYALEIANAQRTVLGLDGRLAGDQQTFSGNWRADLRDSDLAPFVRGRPLPVLTASGSGAFSTDLSFARIRAKGTLAVQASRLQVLHPALPDLGVWSADANWEGRWESGRIRIDRLDVQLRDAQPVGSISTLQPFAWNPADGQVEMSRPAGDLLSVHIVRIPERSLSDALRPLLVSGGDVSASFNLSRTEHGVRLVPTVPLTARGVMLSDSKGPLARDLDLEAWVFVEATTGGWKIEWKPATLQAKRRRMAEFRGSAAGVWDDGSPPSLGTTWEADFTGVSGLFPGLPAARAASGQLKVTWSDPLDIETQFKATGLGADHTLSGTLDAQVTTHGSVHFQAPLTLTLGPRKTDLDAEGTWSDGPEGPNLAIRLKGGSATLDDIRTLARPFEAYAFATSGHPGPSDGRDVEPAWGPLSASGGIEFAQLWVGSEELDEVAGTFTIDHSKIHLVDGKGRWGLVNLIDASGTLSFDPLNRQPYALKAGGTFKDTDAGPFLSSPHSGDPPWVEGRFSIDAKVEGSGVTLADLYRNTREEFQLESSSAIVRLLRTNVADAIPEASTPVADAVGSVGSFVGSVFGVNGGGGSSGKNPLSKNAEAVVDFTNQVEEIGCDKVRVTANRDSEGVVRIPSIQIDARDERMSGSGTIAFKPGVALFDRPLSLELHLGVRDQVAKLLSTAGLLEPGTGLNGFRTLAATIHLGGTLRNIDGTAWHDLLAKAAVRKPSDSASPGKDQPRAAP